MVYINPDVLTVFYWIKLISFSLCFVVIGCNWPCWSHDTDGPWLAQSCAMWSLWPITASNTMDGLKENHPLFTMVMWPAVIWLQWSHGTGSGLLQWYRSRCMAPRDSGGRHRASTRIDERPTLVSFDHRLEPFKPIKKIEFIAAFQPIDGGGLSCFCFHLVILQITHLCPFLCLCFLLLHCIFGGSHGCQTGWILTGSPFLQLHTWCIDGTSRYTVICVFRLTLTGTQDY